MHNMKPQQKQLSVINNVTCTKVGICSRGYNYQEFAFQPVYFDCSGKLETSIQLSLFLDNSVSPGDKGRLIIPAKQLNFEFIKS